MGFNSVFKGLIRKLAHTLLISPKIYRCLEPPIFN